MHHVDGTPLIANTTANVPWLVAAHYDRLRMSQCVSATPPSNNNWSPRTRPRNRTYLLRYQDALEIREVGQVDVSVMVGVVQVETIRLSRELQFARPRACLINDGSGRA